MVEIKDKEVLKRLFDVDLLFSLERFTLNSIEDLNVVFG